MPNIKNNTLTLCEHLDILKIPIEPKINQMNIYQTIIKLYSSIKNVKINHISSEYIEGEPNMCLIIEILKYMLQQNMIDTINLSKKDCTILKNFIIQNKQKDISIFLNQHSRVIYEVIGNYIWNRKLPSEILQKLDIR